LSKLFQWMVIPLSRKREIVIWPFFATRCLLSNRISFFHKQNGFPPVLWIKIKMTAEIVLDIVNCLLTCKARKLIGFFAEKL
jgi:hypothetical protein